MSHQLVQKGEDHGDCYSRNRSRQERLCLGADATGRAVLVRPSVARGKLLEMVAALPPCLIGMQACSGAHHWAGLFQAHGHAVRLMAPKFLTPTAYPARKARTTRPTPRLSARR